MNILVVSQYYYPEDFRINDICEGLVQNGHKVTVITGLPNYPKGEVFDGYENSYQAPEINNGVNIFRCNVCPRHSGIINLARNYASFVHQANKCIDNLGGNYDAIYVYQLSPITLALPAIRYKKANGIPLYIYICDIWPESIRELSSNHILSKKNPLYLVAKALSKYIYNKANLIGLKCKEFGDYINDVCAVPRDKMRILPEHAEKNYLSVTKEPINNGIIDFMFLGNLGYTSNCECIIRATALLNETNKYLVHFVGDGSEMNHLKEMTEELGLHKKIVFHGRCLQSDVIEYYDIADICLLTLSSKTATGMTPPAKIVGYMAAARPIIASIDGPAQTLIDNAKCGMYVPANDIEGLARLLQQAIDNYSEFSALGANGRKYFEENFTLERHIEALEKQLKEMIENKR